MISLNNKYGYKLLFEDGNKKKTLYSITNTLNLALFEAQNYLVLSHRKKRYLPANPNWFIDDVKSLKEYNKLWKDCPFKEDFN